MEITMNDTISHAPASELGINEYIELYKISDNDLDIIRAFGKLITDDMPAIIESFYIWLKEQPEFEQFFYDETILGRVIGMQETYWTSLFKASLDENYMRNRRIIGEVHARIGLPLPIYFAAMNTMLELFSTLIVEKKMSADKRTNTIRALTKMVQMDTSIVVATYSQITNETISSQSRTLIAMSTPVTEIWENVLLLPIVGVVDSQRAQDIMNTMLTKISETSAKIAIIDIGGVAVVDTAVANHLIKITKASKLMGCHSTISGLSPAIAQTIVELGIDVGDVNTTATLRDALANAFITLDINLVIKR